MAKTAWYGTDIHQKEFVKLFYTLTARHSRWTVWSDFVTMIAIEISNAVDESNRPGRSEMYAALVAKYNDTDRHSIALMFCEVVRGLEQNPDQDFLGELFMGLGLSNEHNGQFFTPYNVCRMMAQITGTDLRTRINDRGWISVNDCPPAELALFSLPLLTNAGGRMSTAKLRSFSQHRISTSSLAACVTSN